MDEDYQFEQLNLLEKRLFIEIINNQVKILSED